MSATAGPSEPRTAAGEKFGLTRGQVVQELGWDEDVDDGCGSAVEDAIDGELIEEAMDAVDVVLLWWRDDDGDLVDGLVDSVADLSASGVLWLLTPKVGRNGYVDNSDISEGSGHRRVGPDHLGERLARLGGAQAGPTARHPPVSERPRQHDGPVVANRRAGTRLQHAATSTARRCRCATCAVPRRC